MPDFTGEGGVYDLGIAAAPAPHSSSADRAPRANPISATIIPYTRRHIANALASYEVQPGADGSSAEGKYVRSTAYTFAQPTYDFSTTLFADNAFLNAAVRQRGGRRRGVFSRDNFDFGVRRYELERELFRAVVSAEGEIRRT